MVATAPTGNNKLVVFYDEAHLSLVREYVHAHPGARVLACGLWLERLLDSEGLPYESARSHVPQGDTLGTLLANAEALARAWYRHTALGFFSFEGIPLGEAVEPAIDAYLQRLLYAVHTLSSARAAHPQRSTLVVPEPTQIVPETAGPCSYFEVRAYRDAAVWCERHQNSFVEYLGTETVRQIAPFPRRSVFLQLGLGLYNAVVGILPRKSRRIYASEYWKNIAPLVAALKDTELILMDRSEGMRIPLPVRIRHRIRLMHPLDGRTRRIRREANALQQQFITAWAHAKYDLQSMPELIYAQTSLWELFEPVGDFIVTRYAERMVSDALAFDAIWRREQITSVLLRASVSHHQHHFYMAGMYAPRIGIPSIELQHSNEIADPHSVHSRLAASYLASYGEGTRAMLVRNHGYDPKRIRAIGSPRFDRYLQHEKIDRDRELEKRSLDPKRPVVFVGVPAELADLYFVHFDSYALASFFEELAALKSQIPDVQFILKFRPRTRTEAHTHLLNELFPEGDIYLAEYEDPFTLMRSSDVILTGNSALMYEGMLARRPVVLYPLRPHDTYFPAAYQEALEAPRTLDALVGVVRTVLTHDVQEHAVERQNTFLAAHYTFNGHASDRMAALLEEDLVPYVPD